MLLIYLTHTSALKDSSVSKFIVTGNPFLTLADFFFTTVMKPSASAVEQKKLALINNGSVQY